MPAYTPVTSMPWKKTFATCCAGLSPSPGTALETEDASGSALTLPFTCMILGVFLTYSSTGHTCT